MKKVKENWVMYTYDDLGRCTGTAIGSKQLLKRWFMIYKDNGNCSYEFKNLDSETVKNMLENIEHHFDEGCEIF